MIIGTTNSDKVREIAALCVPLGIELETQALDIAETADTFAGNCYLKAKGYAAGSPGKFVLVEDSGLVVPALDGLPGPWSARFAHLDVASRRVRDVAVLSRAEIDEANNRRLLEMMEDLPLEKRAASFVVHMMVAKDGLVLFQAEAQSFGWIAFRPEGGNGFGYDPVFIGADTFGKTYAELDGARKNLRSHRAVALRKLELWLSQQVRDGVVL